MFLIQVLKISNAGKIILTEDGISFLETNNLEDLYKTLARNVFGVAEMMEFIHSAGEPVQPQQIHEFFTSDLGADWESMHQVTFRINWLISLNKLKKTKEGVLAIE